MILVRERPSLRHTHEIVTPSGRHYRWASDERRADNVLGDPGWSSTVPGGFEQFSGSLARKPDVDYADLERLSRFRTYGPGGAIVWEGRLQASPRTSGDQFLIAPNAVGYQSALDDDKSAVMTYVDRDLSHWGPVSVAWRLNQVSSGSSPSDAGAKPDPSTGAPALAFEVNGPWDGAAAPDSQAMYDGGFGNGIGTVFYALKRNVNVAPTDRWTVAVVLSNDDTLGITNSTGNLLTALPTTGSISASDQSKRYALVRFFYAAAPSSVDNSLYGVYATVLAVFGLHGLTPRGPLSATDAPGLYASDIVAHAVGRWAPQLNFSTGAGGTIAPSGFVVPHAAFLEPTTASEIVKQATRFELQDWAVWDNRTFYWHPRGARGKRWRARAGAAKLQETGPSADRLYNSVVVRYTDGAGATHAVGPPDARVEFRDARLQDSDPANPCNKLGISRRGLMTMGTSTPAGAIQVGARFLAEQKLIDRSGQASLIGHVLDDRGVLWPTSRVRAGDSIVFTDAADTSERRVVKASYSDRDKTCQLDLDAPPESLAALLERMSVVLEPLGLS